MSELIIRARFEEKYIPVTESGCWIWIAGVCDGGYGRFWDGLQHITAHRYSWQLENGKIPEGMNVLHNCDNPSCVNPSHLRIGTQIDNINDRDRKRRMAHKLSVRDVEAIRNSKLSQSQLAKHYGVDQSNISLIKARKTWRD